MQSLLRRKFSEFSDMDDLYLNSSKEKERKNKETHATMAALKLNPLRAYRSGKERAKKTSAIVSGIVTVDILSTK